MGTIEVHRPIDDLGGYLRRLKVYIDGSEVAGLGPKQTHAAEVADGAHTVQVRMDFLRSLPLTVDVTGDGVVNVEVRCGFLSMFKAFIGPRRALHARQQ